MGAGEAAGKCAEKALLQLWKLIPRKKLSLSRGSVRLLYVWTHCGCFVWTAEPELRLVHGMSRKVDCGRKIVITHLFSQH